MFVPNLDSEIEYENLLDNFWGPTIRLTGKLRIIAEKLPFYGLRYSIFTPLTINLASTAAFTTDHVIHSSTLTVMIIVSEKFQLQLSIIDSVGFSVGVCSLLAIVANVICPSFPLNLAQIT